MTRSTPVGCCRTRYRRVVEQISARLPSSESTNLLKHFRLLPAESFKADSPCGGVSSPAFRVQTNAAAESARTISLDSSLRKSRNSADVSDVLSLADYTSR
jgi:hypothetical protein